MNTYPTSPRPVRSYDLRKIPESHRLIMDHSHAPSVMINLIQQGFDFPRYKTSDKMVFELRSDDIKILEAHEWLSKSRYCIDCKEEITYQFRLLRPEEKREMTLRVEVTKKNPKGKEIL